VVIETCLRVRVATCRLFTALLIAIQRAGAARWVAGRGRRTEARVTRAELAIRAGVILTLIDPIKLVMNGELTARISKT
jgi:hypothetical protein